MNLNSLLQARVNAGTPVRAGLIGAGKFGAMFLSQVPTIEGLVVTAIADLKPDAARHTCKTVGWHDDDVAVCHFTDDGESLCERDDVEVVIEATGNPTAGVVHALAAIQYGKHLIMVNVEADVLAGAALAQRAQTAGVVYSMAYGDQPALIAEMVDWARASGFRVAAAGKGTRYLPSYHEVTPDDVWSHYGLSESDAQAAGMNPQMFNSFLDGTKSAIEMSAVGNACDLHIPSAGLQFPACGVDDLAQVLRPESVGGVLETTGTVEVVSSLNTDTTPVFRDLRWGVYVVLEAPNDYAAACFKQYGLPTDSTGQYASQYKPFHLIGLELSISVLNAALRSEPTGSTLLFRGDAVCIAKRDLLPGDTLDGEGGYTVWGRLMPATESVSCGALPIGLAHSVRVVAPVNRGDIVTFSHVSLDESTPAFMLRREHEALAT